MFVDLQDLIDRYGADRVLQLLDHDGDGVCDEKLSQGVLADADAEVASLLYAKGFTHDQVRGMAGDPLIRRHATVIAISYAGQTKQEFLDSAGAGPYDAVADKARALIREIAGGQRRAMKGEMSAGANTSLRGDILDVEPQHYFVPTADKPRGPGGF